MNTAYLIAQKSSFRCTLAAYMYQAMRDSLPHIVYKMHSLQTTAK